MKKPVRLTFLIAAVLAVFVFLLAETVVVKIKTTNLRRDPKFTAPIVAAIKAGEPLEKIEAQNGWFKVKTKAGIVGWIHSTAVETRKVNLSAIDKTMKTQASAGEVALAARASTSRSRTNTGPGTRPPISRPSTPWKRSNPRRPRWRPS